MAGTPKTYTGEDSSIWIGSGANKLTHTTLGLADCTITLDRSITEQSLLGAAGNYHTAGSISAEISLTHSKLDANLTTVNLIDSVVKKYDLWISGSAGDNSLHFYLISCQLTGYDLSLGNADTITEGSIDLTVRTPYQITRTLKPGYEGVYISNA